MAGLNFDHNTLIANANAISSAHRVSDLVFTKDKQTVLVRKYATIPLLGRLISWIRFVLADKNLIDSYQKSYNDVKNAHIATYNKETLAAVSALFQENINTLANDVAIIKTYQRNITLLAQANPKNSQLTTPAIDDHLKNELKQKFLIGKDLFADTLKPGMKLSPKALLNAPYILEHAMKEDGVNDLKGYLQDIPQEVVDNLKDLAHFFHSDLDKMKKALVKALSTNGPISKEEMNKQVIQLVEQPGMKNMLNDQGKALIKKYHSVGIAQLNEWVEEFKEYFKELLMF